MNKMLEISDRNRMTDRPSTLVLRALRVAACGLAIGIVLSSGVARAGDDDDEDESFERTIIDNIMKGVQGRRFDNSGIEYRERSPLVIPPKIDLPPPAANQAASVPNWPKDPEVKRRRADIEAKRKARMAARDNIADPRVLNPSEVNGDMPALAREKQSGYQSTAADPQVFKPSEYGYTGGIFGGMFKKDDDVAKFNSEPPRSSLTQPPAGYQTPSPSYAYGMTGASAPPAPGTTAKSEDGPMKPGTY